MIDYDIIEKHINKKDPEIINYDDLIELKLIKLLSKYSKSSYSPLFEKNYLTQYPIKKYKVEAECSKCNNIKIIELSKTKMLDYINQYKNNEYICIDCVVDIEKKHIKILKKEKTIFKKELKKRVKKYFRLYLNKDREWKKDTKYSVRWVAITRPLYNDYIEKLVNKYICSMKYSDFLNTLYWKTIAQKVRYSYGFKCQLCGNSDNQLNIHHNNYERHGLEHIYWKEDLICICNTCHKKHHNIGA